MQDTKHWLIAAPAAAILTTGIFLGMIKLISGEWVPQDKARAEKFEINPVVKELDPPRERTEIAKLEAVITPPPPPRITTQTADKPTEPIATEPGAIPPFEMPPLSPTDFIISVTDKNIQPINRFAPMMPNRFLEGNYSGHCKVRFDVSAEGSPFNVTTTSCTNSILERPTVKSVQKWRFLPKVQNGRAVAMQGVENRVTFQLLDERGELLPEP